MNPELPAPQLNPEYQPPSPETSGRLDDTEKKGEQTHEREQNMRQVDRENTPPPPAALPLPLPTAPLPSVIPKPTSDDTAGPTIAADDDLIEKEWVDKAKKIITETQNDPYRREQEIAQLQIDYLRKRYGKELGTSN
jgi:hypothetical protein